MSMGPDIPIEFSIFSDGYSSITPFYTSLTMDLSDGGFSSSLSISIFILDGYFCDFAVLLVWEALRFSTGWWMRSSIFYFENLNSFSMSYLLFSLWLSSLDFPPSEGSLCIKNELDFFEEILVHVLHFKIWLFEENKC